MLFLIYYFKIQFKLCVFILKALRDILQHFKFVNWWFRFLMSRTGYTASLSSSQWGQIPYKVATILFFSQNSKKYFQIVQNWKSKWFHLEIVVFNELKCDFIKTAHIYFLMHLKETNFRQTRYCRRKKNVEDIIPSNLWAQFGLYCHCQLAYTHPRSSSLFTP